MAEMNRFENKVAIVTGAATGSGRAVARRLAGKGAKIAILDLQAGAAEEVAATLPGAIALGCDVLNETAVISSVAAVAARCGGVDVLVNPALFCIMYVGSAGPKWLELCNFLDKGFQIRQLIFSGKHMVG